MLVELPVYIKESILILLEITEIQNCIKEFKKISDIKGLVDTKLKYREALVR